MFSDNQNETQFDLVRYDGSHEHKNNIDYINQVALCSPEDFITVDKMYDENDE